MIEEKKLNYPLFKVINIFIYCFLIILFYIFFNSFENGNYNFNSIIYFLSVFGLLYFIYIIISEYMITKQLFSLYNFFMLFFILFNFGQCLLWVFNIHLSGEIGTTSLYTLSAPTKVTIIRTQLVVLMSLISLHMGSILSYKKDNMSDNKKVNLESINYSKILNASIIIFVVASIASIINIVHSIIIANKYGYISLYYGEMSNSGNTIVILLGKLFIPSLIGMLVGSKFHKKYIIISFISFALYTTGWLMCGDRGAWIYALVLLFALSDLYIKKINFKKFIKYFLIGFVALIFLNALVTIRSNGLSLASLINAIDLKNNPIITEVFEMGKSMRVTSVILQNNVVYPYGNSFFNGIVCTVSENVMLLFNPNYINLSSWFSQKYLKISYGAGFSIVGEVLLNFGATLLPLIMLLFGFIISRLLYLKSSDINNPYRIIIVSCFFLCISPFCRGTFQNFTKSFFYTYVVFVALIFFLSKFKK